MSDINIRVDTSTLSGADKRATTDFTVRMASAINLESLRYNLILTNLNTFYAIPNIIEDFGNNTITVRYIDGPTDETRTITFPEGIYSFEDFRLFVVSEMSDFVSPDALVLSVNYNTGKFKRTINIVGTETVTVTIPFNLLVMLGFVDKETAATADWRDDSSASTQSVTGTSLTVESEFIPEWAFGITSLQVECSLANGSVSNGQSSQVIATFVPAVNPYSQINVEPINPPRLQINTRNIKKIDFLIADQSGRQIVLNEELSLNLVIRPWSSI